MNQQENKIERLNQVEKGKKKKKDAFVDWKSQLWGIFRISNNWHGPAKPGARQRGAGPFQLPGLPVLTLPTGKGPNWPSSSEGARGEDVELSVF